MKLSNALTGIRFAGKTIGKQIAGLILEVREVRPLRQTLRWHMNVPSSWCLSSAFAGRKDRSWIDLDEGGLLSFPRIGGAPARRSHSTAALQRKPGCVDSDELSSLLHLRKPQSEELGCWNEWSS